MAAPFPVTSPSTTGPGSHHLPFIKFGQTHRHHRRLFIGAMPQRVVEHKENTAATPTRRWFDFLDSLSGGDESDSYLEDAFEDHAHQYFLHHGGQEDDWGEERRKSVRKEMLEEWRSSDWGRAILRLKHKERGTVPWVGSTFEVGEFAGINVFDGESMIGGSRSRISISKMRADSTESQVHPPSPHSLPALSIGTGDTFHTAREDFFTPKPSSSAHSVLSPSSIPDEEIGPTSGSSSTALLTPQLRSQQTNPGPLRSSLIVPQIPRVQSDGVVHGKGKKAVRVQIVEPAKEIPASPQDVLERTGSEIEGTSAAATQEANVISPQLMSGPYPPLEYPDENIIMRDRMLVRVSLTPDKSIGAGFDEERNRRTQHMDLCDWREFMVVWRPGRIELYDDFHIPFKEYVVGHKRLAYSIPINSSAAKLTLYSFTDLSFCIACGAEDSRLKGVKTDIPFFMASYSSVYICKVKSRTRAIDWVWKLWQQLGGQLPPYIELRLPSTDLSLKVEVPPSDEGNMAIFRHDNLFNLCKRTLSSLPDWKHLSEEQQGFPGAFAFAWRMDTRLDWIWWTDDVQGKQRAWSVLSGIALSQPGKIPQLEFRAVTHFPSAVRLKEVQLDEPRVEEPQPVEGYLRRIKPRSHKVQEVYLTVHDGMLFTLPQSHAQTPDPPGATPAPSDDPEEDYYEKLRKSEVKRGARQIIHARGVTDLRGVLMVRRAFQLVSSPHETIEPLLLGRAAVPSHIASDEQLTAAVEKDDEDERDTGGEQGLQQRGGDRRHAQMRRCFELVMRTGEIIRFEARSAVDAIKWIERLRALVRYWRLRHTVDARQEMDIEHLTTGKPFITPRRHVYECELHTPPEPIAQPLAVLQELGSFYNWCIFDSCRPVGKTGRIYARSGYKGRYQLVHLFVTDGHLVRFRINGRMIFHPRQSETVGLLDAYVVSGFLAAQLLPAGEYRPNLPPKARRYGDGLEADDRVEDTLFIVIYYPHTAKTVIDGGRIATPALNAGSNMLVCRARSRLERDLWCWAINTEIEKVARAQKEREETLRTTGTVYRRKQAGAPPAHEAEARGAESPSPEL